MSKDGRIYVGERSYVKSCIATYAADLMEVSQELGVDDDLLVKPIYDALMDIDYITMSLGTVTLTEKGLKEIQK